MLRLPLLNLASRETNRLPAVEINKKLGCDPRTGHSLPLEQEGIIWTPSDKFVVYYGSDYYGELPPDHNKQTIHLREHNFLLVKVDGYHEYVIDEGTVETNLRIHMMIYKGESKSRPHSHFIAYGGKLGRFSFYCTSPNHPPEPTVASPTTLQSTGAADSGFKAVIDHLSGQR